MQESEGMGLWRIMVLDVLLQWPCTFVLLAAAIGAVPIPLATKSGCRRSCGNLSIPYPFGMEEGCYLDDSFLISCNENPTLAKSTVFQPNSNIKVKVLDISVDGELRVLLPVSYDCSSWNQIIKHDNHFTLSFPVSYTRNDLTAVGCDTCASLYGSSSVEVEGYASECSSQCQQFSDIVNGSCSGTGCRQTYLPKQMKDFWITASSDDDEFHANISNFSPCSFAFLVEQGKYNFSSLDLVDLQNNKEFPVIMDWAVSNTTCQEAEKDPQTYACRANNTLCYDFKDNGFGYRCSCSQGYNGNPYLPNGCQDMNECINSSLNQCVHPKLCVNKMGSYACSCPQGHHGDGRKDGQGCISYHWPWIKIIIIAIGASSTVVALIGLCYMWCEIRMRKVREGFFKENGGLLIQEMLSKTEKVARIFLEKELKKATDNFNENKIVGRGGYGIVYQGTLKDGTRVAIKKSRMMNRTQFINEVIVLSQVNHPNVVKLLGCCLETLVPLLVYEFITNSTLHHHLHDEVKISSMSWNTRLRIAAETAAALAHMHSDAPMQIIHRDIKSANILLDHNFTAKISDFGVSRLVPLDQTDLSTVVQGTIGYIDPQYYETGLLNEKSDVYSFGVILAELFTGKQQLFPPPGSSNNEKGVLATFFTSSFANGDLLQIIEERVKNEGQEKQLIQVAELANQCLSRSGDDRPTMKVVKRDLDQIFQAVTENSTSQL